MVLRGLAKTASRNLRKQLEGQPERPPGRGNPRDQSLCTHGACICPSSAIAHKSIWTTWRLVRTDGGVEGG